MNGFRITILTLLCLSLGLMFYAIVIVVPTWQSEYNAYQTDKRLSKFERRSDLHRHEMITYAPDAETPEVERARLAAEKAAQDYEKTIFEAEENSVLEMAKQREEAARARAEQEEAATRTAEEKRPSLGVVASYDKTWQCVMITPALTAGSAYVPKATLAVYRSGRFLCEVIIDKLDTQSGQVSATVRVPQGTPGVNADGSLSAELEPQPGDVVAASPFPSTDELRYGGESDLQGSELPTLRPELTTLVEDDAQDTTQDDTTEGDVTLPSLPETPSAGVQEPSAEVRRALDALPAAPSAVPTKNSKLPSLDALLQPSPF